MITKKEIKQVVNRELGKFFQPEGFVSCKVPSEVIATYEKQTDDFFYSFSCYVVKHDEFKLVYGFGFGINKVVEILKQVESMVPLAKQPYSFGRGITAISPGSLRNPLDTSAGYRYFATEEELISILKEIEVFYQTEFVPFAEKFSIVGNLDKQFNSFDNFYTTGWGKSPSLNFFYVTRLIVAFLAQNPEFDKVVEMNFQVLEELWRKEGLTYDRNDTNKPEVVAARFLKSLKS